MKSLFSNRNFFFGFTITIILSLCALAAPFLSGYDPIVDADLAYALVPPNTEFWMGTDQYGRDILSRILYGSRISLSIGIIVQLINSVIGISLGLCAGYFGGFIDDIVMGLTNIMLSMPPIILSLAIMVVLGPGIINLYIALGLIGWTYTCRVARGEALSIRERQFTEAARAQGTGHIKIIFRHILPNTLGPVVVIATLGVADAILTAATLGFLGLGVQPPSPELGAMLSQGRDYIWNAPWLCIFPGLTISLVVLGLNLLGDGIRDVIDPHMQDV